MLERVMETGDGSISRKDALANGVPPATFARYVRSHHLFRISQGVYAKEGAVDELFQWQRRYPRMVYSGITALYLLGLTDRTPASIDFTMPKGCRVRKESIAPYAVCHIKTTPNYSLGAMSAPKPCLEIRSLVSRKKR